MTQSLIIEKDKPNGDRDPGRKHHRLSLSVKAGIFFKSCVQRLFEEIRAQEVRLPLWRPVAFGTGTAIYFHVPYSEPIAPLGLALGVCIILNLILIYKGFPSLVCHIMIFISLGLAGFLVAHIRTDQLKTPVVAKDLGPLRIEGRIIDIKSSAVERPRILIAPDDIGFLDHASIPKRIRVVLAKDSEAGQIPAPGDYVSLLAILNPPPGPSDVGAYDFARDAYFQQIGAVGAVLGHIHTISPSYNQAQDWDHFKDNIEVAINGWRWKLAETLANYSRDYVGHSHDSTGLLIAVATSHEAFLSQDSEDDLRGSGLAHMLAIAGLHMAAVSGFIYIALRALIRSWPALALRLDGKKVAALGGLIVIVLYLLLSGGHAPARRASITAGIAFLAILTHRHAISLYALSIAALVILVLEPENIIAPGFQMSFCAAGALIAFSEVWHPRREKILGQSFLISFLQKLYHGATSLGMVALIAGLATGPFAVQYFNRSALYGTFANLLADFLASAVMMPGLVLTTLGISFHLSHYILGPILMVTHASAGGILSIAHVFSHLPGAQITIASAPEPALWLSFFGIIFAILWKGYMRTLGMMAAMSVFLWPRPPDPIGWIAPDGVNAAIVDHGQVIAMRPDRRLFTLQSFAQHRGLQLSTENTLFDCHHNYCFANDRLSPRISAWFTRAKPSEANLTALCQSDILIFHAAIAVPETCQKPLILRPEIFDKYGAATILKTPGGWRLDWTIPYPGRHPWSR